MVKFYNKYVPKLFQIFHSRFRKIDDILFKILEVEFQRILHYDMSNYRTLKIERNHA